MSTSHLDPTRRHDFILLFDVSDGNPNGDPDAGNLPRVDPETMQGIVTDVCLKRKVRDYVDTARGKEDRFKIYVERRGVLNEQHRRAYTAEKIEVKGSKQPQKDIDVVQRWMCENFYDIRTFGAVMNTSVNCGQVRGPMQLTFARSIDPIVPLDISITRVAITKSEDAVQKKEPKSGSIKKGSDEDASADQGEEMTGKQTEMGRKAYVPYGLYRCHGFYNPMLANRTGFDGDDLALFWEALERCWDLDRSAARGWMTPRGGIHVFSHADEKGLGNMASHKLFSRIQCSALQTPPRRFEDYRIAVDSDGLEEQGVTYTQIC